MKKFLGLFVFVALLFSACAPSVPGSSRYTALDARESRSASITAGPEWFVKTSGPARIVSLRTRNSSLDSLFATRSEVNLGAKKSQNVNWVRVKDVKAPSGWVVELVTQEATREITDVDGSGGYSFTDSLTLTWLIKAPPTASVGQYAIVPVVFSPDKPDEVSFVFLNIEITPQPKK